MGYGPELERLVDSLGIRDRTLMTGLLTARTRLEAMADADVVCYPSKDEIFGLVPIEALLSGTPVVVADDSGCGEIIGEVGGGRVVRQGDVEALTAAVADLVEASGVWRARARDAAGLVRARYGADVICDRLETVYHEVLASRGR
jgi:glycosyltransferase involved in cell wall biosynthesis